MLRNVFFALAVVGALASVRKCHHRFDASAATLASPLAPRQAGPPDSNTAADHVVLQWNDEALAAVMAKEPRATVATRNLYILHSAVYDAWAMHDPVANPVALDTRLRRDARGRTEQARREAVCFAAWRALVLMFPSREENFTSLLKRQGYDPRASADTSTPSGLGRAAAERMFASRADDGANASGDFADTTGYVAANSDDPSSDRFPGQPGFDANRWQPLRVPTGAVKDASGNPIVVDSNPDSFRVQKFLTPHWGRVKPFALTEASQFRPQPPPKLGSSEPYVDVKGVTLTNEKAWVREFDQVLATSAGLTDEQKVCAEFWAGRHGSEFWNHSARDVLMRDSKGIDDDVRLLFALNGALLDASIACWDSKRAYDFVRPISALRHRHRGERIRAWGGPNKGTVEMRVEQWLPYQRLDFVTPSFPEAVSGHATSAGTGAEIMRRYTGSDVFYDGKTTLDVDRDGDGVPDKLGQFVASPGFLKIEKGPATRIELRWRTFSEAANDCCSSRLYSGIHITESNIRGRDLGILVGAQAFRRAKAYWEGKSVQ